MEDEKEKSLPANEVLPVKAKPPLPAKTLGKTQARIIFLPQISLCIFDWRSLRSLTWKKRTMKKNPGLNKKCFAGRLLLSFCQIIARTPLPIGAKIRRIPPAPPLEPPPKFIPNPPPKKVVVKYQSPPPPPPIPKPVVSSSSNAPSSGLGSLDNDADDEARFVVCVA